jgi:glycosyltransferase involved in cell wall biosynthesis
MKVMHINFSDQGGGAAIAVNRIHEALLLSKVNSVVLVNRKVTDGSLYIKSEKLIQSFIISLLPRLGSFVLKLFLKKTSVNSLNLFSSGWVKFINQSDSDIVHLHWIGGEMISISDIPKIKKPIIWTFHDMWPFCGTEHVTYDFRFIHGYHLFAKKGPFPLFDINGLIWHYKIRLWNNKNFTIVCPSNWMSDCVLKSQLFKGWDTFVIPNPIDVNLWKPRNVISSKCRLGIQSKEPVLLFGAYDGIQSFHKGFDLLIESINLIKTYLDECGARLLVFGTGSYNLEGILNYPCEFLGHINDIDVLIDCYNSADLLLIPSRIDNLPNTALESLSCGTPIVAFNTCGLPDIVIHKQNGYLADSFSVADFATGIVWALENISDLEVNARNSAIDKFKSQYIASKYVDIYEKILSRHE